ncbi:EAL domain-containing protein [Actinoplanes sp. Pm04-4]|uniref:EAL domain-containing protein n=1 Tax=Paractinoplanes pyxinae TaxID=2997416 RepID=A0ABT4AR70_9ACTN|nr:EAL domain-containing protein [Actinoplanes pyxinae]MCY1136726.1 EAL domain-containing protein [Actinoplanes pyxinae]
MTAALAVANAAVFAVDTVTGERWLKALSVLLAGLACLLAGWMCARLPERGVRRVFWRLYAAAQFLYALAWWLRLDYYRIDVPALPAVSRTLKVAAVIVMVGAILLLPMRRMSRSEVVTLTLDMSTVLAAGALFAWHLVVEPVRAGSTSLAEAGPTVGHLVGGVLGIGLVMKVVFGRRGDLAPGALRMIGLTALVGGPGMAVSTLFDRWPGLEPNLVVGGFAALLVAAAVRYQAVGPAGTADQRRMYTLYPYTAIAAVGALLMQTVVTRAADAPVITAGALVLATVVVARQLLTLRENDRLGERFRLLVQNSTDVVMIAEADGAVRYVSPSVGRVLGREPDELLGRGILGLAHPDDLPAVRTAFLSILEAPGASVTMHARYQHADGSWRWLETTGANFLHEPSLGGIVTNNRDITETRTIQDRLSHDATHDALTGLANRVLFAERIARSTAGPPDHRFSVVLIDLDDFKTVNDTLGHHVGDDLLVAVAERMVASVRPVDTVARLGGDEFAVLFEDLGGDHVDRALRRIAEALLIPVEADGQLLSVRASFGVAEGRAGDDPADLMRHADIAMYEAKARGEGGHQRYVTGMESRAAERSRRHAELRRAVAEDQFVLHYQPVVTLPEGSMAGAEALVRWQHPDRGLLGPGEFIEAAEETGLIVPLGRWVLREAVRQAAAWRTELGEAAPRTVSVNASPRQLQDPDFAAEVAGALAEAGLPAAGLTVEITESTAVGGGATQTNLAAVREMGVRVALDDFGTGASTLSLLVDCPVDQIKLDRSFVPEPGRDAIARAVLQLAQAMDVEAVAEGVETPEQAARLTEMGYRRAQGYHFARPMPADRLSVLEPMIPGRRAGP